MPNYKVIALSVGGLGNKVFKLGDEVKDTNFPRGHADELVTKGFLAKIEDPKEAKKPEAPKVETPKGDAPKATKKANTNSK
jgi:hypothetical protein